MEEDLRSLSLSPFSFSRQFRSHKAACTVVLALLSAMVIGHFYILTAFAQAAGPKTDAQLLEGYRHVEVASVSDALDQVTGQRNYMSHRMRPIFNSKVVGFALTVQLKKEENHDPGAIQGMLAAIDQGQPNSVWVMVIEDGANIAGMGGLMGTAMASRDFSGAVIDGGVRDVSYLQKIGFPVFSLGIVPSTLVDHYRFAGANIPVKCDGVTVNAGDIIAADEDGVVVVPRAQAAAVLAVAQEMDIKEHSMYGYIEKFKSIEEAVKHFGRL